MWNLLAEMFAGRESDVARGMQAVLPTPNPYAPTLGQALVSNAASLLGQAPVTPTPMPTPPPVRAPYTQMEYAQRMAAQAAAAQAAAREQAAAQAAAAQQQALLSDLMRKRMAAGRGYQR